VRKIISILLALGLVLGLSAIATPVAADVTEPEVTLGNPCACETSSYTIVFNITASLTEGVGCVCIKFPAGTTVPATFETGDITINTEDVHAEEITVTGTEVCFIPPAHVDDPGPVTVVFTTDAGIKNPCDPGPYKLEVKTCRAPDADYVESEEYVIQPATSTYAFTFDFSPTYAGLAEGFVPPLKECGQEGFGSFNKSGLDEWATNFTLTFAVDEEGCDVPCVNATIFLVLTALGDDDAIIHFFFDTTEFVLDDEDLDEPVGVYNITGLTTNWTMTWNSSIHVDTMGKGYEICFYAECPGSADPCDPYGEEEFARDCLEVDVYQFKEAFKIPLYRKWNLISLPLVPLVDPPVEETLASYAYMDQIEAIWHYDRCDNEWLVWPAGIPGADAELTEIVDGKGYWVLIEHTPATMGDPLDGLWIWGTEKPVPPASPSAYPVCDGWNMIGFTSLSPETDANYLWSITFGSVYGWDATNQIYTLVGGGNMNAGQGYWASVSGSGMIYPP
jgi:hypothetical protein